MRESGLVMSRWRVMLRISWCGKGVEQIPIVWIMVSYLPPVGEGGMGSRAEQVEKRIERPGLNFWLELLLSVDG